MKRDLLITVADSSDLGNKVMLDASHQLHQLADSIDWDFLKTEIVRIKGSPYEPVARVVCSSLYLKSFFELSSADVMKKWATCPYHRYFCTGEIIVEDKTPFPMSQFELDMLIGELDEECHEAMINALPASSFGGIDPDATLH